MIEDVIAERELFFEAGRTRRKAWLRIGRPHSEDPRIWCCPMQINGLGSGKVRESAGADALQALFFALAMARVNLDVFAIRAGGKVHWLSRKEGALFTEHVMVQHYWEIIIDLCRGLEEVQAWLSDALDRKDLSAELKSGARKLRTRCRRLVASRNRRRPTP